MKFFILIVVFLSLFGIAPAFADVTTCASLGGSCVANCSSGDVISTPSDCSGTTPTCCAGVVTLTNPLGTTANPIVTPTQLIGTVIKGVLGVIGAVTLGMLIFGGFKWLTSAGNQEQIESGTQTMLWAVIGLFLIFAAYILVGTFVTYLATGGAVTPAVNSNSPSG